MVEQRTGAGVICVNVIIVMVSLMGLMVISRGLGLLQKLVKKIRFSVRNLKRGSKTQAEQT